MFSGLTVGTTEHESDNNICLQKWVSQNLKNYTL